MAVGLAACLAVAVAGLLIVRALESRLIYFPSPQAAPPVAAVLADGEDVSFDTADGVRLRGWFLPARGRPAGPTVLVLNGNAGDRSARAPLAAALAERGMAVLLMDYRGYGGNGGQPSEDGLAADARAARAYLLSRPEVDAGSIVYYGESLGAAVAVRLAAEHPPRALVLRSPFTSLADVGRVHYPFLPVGRLLTQRYDALSRIRSVGCPVLVVAGGADSIVPAALSRRLYEAAREPKRYVEVPGADHNDAALLDGPLLLAEVTGFIRAA